MNATPVPRRRDFEFVALATALFAFLPDSGLALAEVDESRVRFASLGRFVNVYHGRDSYEVGVEVGRWIEVDDQAVEQLFPLVYLLAVQSGETELDRIRSATDRGQLERELGRLASLLKGNLAPLLTDEQIFDQMTELSASLSQRYTEGIRATRLRERAEEAWSRKDLATVMLSYAEIEQELPTVSLRASERARLKYTQEHAEG
jgi:hypothetical protein